MITLRRARERRHDRRRRLEAWLTFDAGDRSDPLADGFGALELLEEDRLPPGTAAPHPDRDAEIVTYVREGALAYRDASGRSGILRAGEFQRRSARRGVRHRETNPSRSDWAHVFQLWLQPAASAADAVTDHEQRRFCAAERRGGLCIIASPDAGSGGLRIQQDARLYSAMLEPGQHVVHELAEGRSAWIHLVHGEGSLGDGVLTTGDGAGVTAERALSLTARAASEILLVDVAADPLTR